MVKSLILFLRQGQDKIGFQNPGLANQVSATPWGNPKNSFGPIVGSPARISNYFRWQAQWANIHFFHMQKPRERNSGQGAKQNSFTARLWELGCHCHILSWALGCCEVMLCLQSTHLARKLVLGLRPEIGKNWSGNRSHPENSPDFLLLGYCSRIFCAGPVSGHFSFFRPKAQNRFSSRPSGLQCYGFLWERHQVRGFPKLGAKLASRKLEPNTPAN